MEFQVDVQMTVRENGIIPLNVIESIFKQENLSDLKGDTLEVHLYIDASKDLVVDNDELYQL